MTPLDGPAAPSMVCEPPGPRSRELLARTRAALYPGTGEGLAPFVAERKRGYTIEDVDGNVIFDLASASASVPLGAARPELLEPAFEAMRRYGNEDSHAVASTLMAPLAERLLALAPGMERVDIALNGTEAVEIAIKFMRRATGRSVVIGFMGGYHGESTATASLGAEHHEISGGMRGLGGGFVHVPYPHGYRSPFAPPRAGGSGDATVDFIADHLLFHAVDPREVAGVVIEPLAGSGGVLEPPAAFWPALRALCDRHGWLLCLDEVKTGIGRTGTLLASERIGIEADLICLGKALGGGVMPIGAVLGSERAAGSFADVPTGSTWAWLPGACAAALATLDLIESEAALANVRALEMVALDVLEPLRERHAAVGDVRVRGCFAALELVRDRATRERDGELQEAVAAGALRRGVFGDSSTTSLNLQPSLLMPPAALRTALELVGDALDAAVAAVAA
ncbi:MAG TPA: aminotransferase class III-fold pyridoxal phosphate-dependent enzyme [Conexibacter sp.]|nr:aminotransferase class III-fold pyridoxal phosphate-dependent enzyme [Conexibacter sp.]